MSLYPLSKNGKTLSQCKESRDWTSVVVSKTQRANINTGLYNTVVWTDRKERRNIFMLL